MLNKQKVTAFGEDVYLLGADSTDVYYWLEAPSWDCGWYWGFGYIKTYTNNKYPNHSQDISSHQHAENFYPEWVKILTNPVFTEKDGWILSEMFERFYFLRKAAEVFGHGGCRIMSVPDEALVEPELVKKINEKLIPSVAAQILAILTPKEDEIVE